RSAPSAAYRPGPQWCSAPRTKTAPRTFEGLRPALVDEEDARRRDDGYVHAASDDRGGAAVAAHRGCDVLGRRGHHGGAAHEGEVEQRRVGGPRAAWRSGDD